MSTVAGIDLGSTTTKAVLLDEEGRIVGQGITNSRSNYQVACAVALEEARLGAALSRLVASAPEQCGFAAANAQRFATAAREAPRLALHRRQLGELRAEIHAHLDSPEHGRDRDALEPAVEEVLAGMEEDAALLFRPGAARRSDFFRDIAGEQFLARAERLASERGLSFERLVALYDRAVLAVETRTDSYDPASLLAAAYDELRTTAPGDLPLPTSVQWGALVKDALADASPPAACAGTGYGRQTLPFDPRAVRSEILCHGRGAHFFFPGTRTVLDIGGQDTKAIQVDETGVVTGFQMNDRCAAGCGRYLGYIADELNLGLHELGPLALQARRVVRVNSTCTVFAGAELRERLALGERREDIVAGLHRAIVLRALSLLSRAGGVRNEFTFTGGVCKNPAATRMLEGIVRENYGRDLRMNVHPDSIYVGALGAALYALDDLRAGKATARPQLLAQPAAAAPERKRARPAVALPIAQPAEATSAAVLHIPLQSRTRKRLLTAGVDVGASAVKAAVVESDGVEANVLATAMQRIRRRKVAEVARATFEEACQRAGVAPDRLAYVASTGDGDGAPFRTGHFFSMTAHARGALLLVPGAQGVLDIGALHARAIRVDERGKVLGHRMTSQCASGTGQFLENVARYLGVPLEDVGALSLRAVEPEAVSSVCAVLAETDVINLVSRGIAAGDILHGIHMGISSRLAKLVASARIPGLVALTGGLALDAGLVATLAAELSADSARKGEKAQVRAHPDSALAGALGAALLGALRLRQLAERSATA